MSLSCREYKRTSTSCNYFITKTYLILMFSKTFLPPPQENKMKKKKKAKKKRKEKKIKASGIYGAQPSAPTNNNAIDQATAKCQRLRGLI